MEVMTARRAALVLRAMEVDDPYPDELCPGCGRPLSMIGREGKGHGNGEFHLADLVSGEPCAWSHSHLVARVWRRRLIRTGKMP